MRVEPTNLLFEDTPEELGPNALALAIGRDVPARGLNVGHEHDADADDWGSRKKRGENMEWDRFERVDIEVT